jgi:hypothetical protein
MTRELAKIHDYLSCFECGQKFRPEEYRKHLVGQHGYSKRKAEDSEATAGWRHSMCRKCWNKQRPHVSSVGHEVPEKFRSWDICCFCGKRHKSGIYARKNPSSRELICR